MAISTRWEPSPVTRPGHFPSIVIRPSSLRPISVKKETAASRDSTTMPTLSIRLRLIVLPLASSRRRAPVLERKSTDFDRSRTRQRHARETAHSGAKRPPAIWTSREAGLTCTGPMVPRRPRLGPDSPRQDNAEFNSAAEPPTAEPPTDPRTPLPLITCQLLAIDESRCRFIPFQRAVSRNTAPSFKSSIMKVRSPFACQSKPLSNRRRTSRFHCAVSGRQVRDPGFSSEVEQAATCIQLDRLFSA